MDKKTKQMLEEKIRTDACLEAYHSQDSSALKCCKCDTDFEEVAELLRHQNDNTLCPCCCSEYIVVKHDGKDNRPFCMNCMTWLSAALANICDLPVYQNRVQTGGDQ